MQNRVVKINRGRNSHQNSLWIVAFDACIVAKSEVQLASVTTIEEDDIFTAHLLRVIEISCSGCVDL